MGVSADFKLFVMIFLLSLKESHKNISPQSKGKAIPVTGRECP
jgi:hypothetical protein